MKPAKVCLDARMIQASGIGTYLQGLLSALESHPLEFGTLSLLGNPTVLPDGPWTKVEASAPIYSIREQWRIPLLVHDQKADLLHSPHYNVPVFSVSKTVVTVHDMIHLKFPHLWPSPIARAYANFFFYHVIPKSKAILTVSENTKRDLMESLSIPENRITVTYPAVDHERFNTTSMETQEHFDRLKLPPDYLLYVGNMKSYKNVETLVEAYGQLRSRRSDFPALVLAGRNFIPGFEREILKTPGIHHLGEIPSDLLPALYKRALIFVFPSLYEGFGLPPLEAMACGTPVICSDRASLPEVVGEAALMINPDKAEDLAAAMERLIQDSSLRKELSIKGIAQAKRFSWDRMAQQTLEVYKECLS